MRRSKPQFIRNKLDLTDPTQVRLVRRRLRLSDGELTEIIGRIGNSISAITKEVAVQRNEASPPQASPRSADLPAAEVIASATGGEQATTEITATAPAS